MGGAVRRPPNGWQKAIKSYSGVVIQPSSNLFYQKFYFYKSSKGLPISFNFWVETFV
jgi:hypothetical protein